MRTYPTRSQQAQVLEGEDSEIVRGPLGFGEIQIFHYVNDDLFYFFKRNSLSLFLENVSAGAHPSRRRTEMTDPPTSRPSWSAHVIDDAEKRTETGGRARVDVSASVRVVLSSYTGSHGHRYSTGLVKY